MNTLQTTAGNPYTKDPDYAAFTGRLVRTVTTTHYDPKLKAWIKRTCEYIDVGRPDAVTPVDADALINTEEPLSMLDGEDLSIHANRRRSEATHNLMQRIITKYLLSYGPTSFAEIVHHTHMRNEWIRLHLIGRENTVYVRIPVNKRKLLWGLVGVHDKEAS